EASLQGIELLAELYREAVSEAGVVLANERRLLAPFVDVHPQQLGDVGVRNPEPLGVERPRGGDVADRSRRGLSAASGALADPGEHARVLPEARPQETTLRILAEPVHVVDAGQIAGIGRL